MLNYVNYFTEIENFYQTKRKTFTLLTTLDWVLIESWKEQGIPLDLVLKGIDQAFSTTKREINSLAYCAKVVAQVCNEQKDLKVEAPALPEFSPDEVKEYLGGLAESVEALRSRFPEFSSKFASIADSVRTADVCKLREAEQSLTALEEKLIALLKVASDEATMLDVKRNVDSELNPFRSTMTTEQLTMLEQQLWRRNLMERFNVSRLSLFYLI